MWAAPTGAVVGDSRATSPSPEGSTETTRIPMAVGPEFENSGTGRCKKGSIFQNAEPLAYEGVASGSADGTHLAFAMNIVRRG